MDKCWPFDPEEKDRSLPSMDVPKFRWWSHELDRRVKRSPKKRSISELFAVVPQIGAVESRSDGPDENTEPKPSTTDQPARGAIADKVESRRKPKRMKKRLRSEVIETVGSKSDGLEEEGELKPEMSKEAKRKKKKVQVQIGCKPKVWYRLLLFPTLTLFCWIKLAKVGLDLRFWSFCYYGACFNFPNYTYI